jgi:hypothetical protein
MIDSARDWIIGEDPLVIERFRGRVQEEEDPEKGVVAIQQMSGVVQRTRLTAGRGKEGRYTHGGRKAGIDP